MSTQISQAAAAAREDARQGDGRFGTQQHTSPGTSVLAQPTGRQDLDAALAAFRRLDREVVGQPQQAQVHAERGEFLAGQMWDNWPDHLDRPRAVQQAWQQACDEGDDDPALFWDAAAEMEGHLSRQLARPDWVVDNASVAFAHPSADRLYVGDTLVAGPHHGPATDAPLATVAQLEGRTGLWTVHDVRRDGGTVRVSVFDEDREVVEFTAPAGRPMAGVARLDWENALNGPDDGFTAGQMADVAAHCSQVVARQGSSRDRAQADEAARAQAVLNCLGGVLEGPLDDMPTNADLVEALRGQEGVRFVPADAFDGDPSQADAFDLGHERFYRVVPA